MNKFLITQISFAPRQDFHMSGNYVIMGNPPELITMEMHAIDLGDETMRKLHNIISAGRPVSINDSEYMDWIEPFKAEFKEFLVEKHPEKILKDQAGFNKLFGVEDETSSSR